jgi:sulfopyruvate decarboxylase TPP-binding subunit
MQKSGLEYDLNNEIIIAMYYINTLEDLLEGVSEEKLIEDIDTFVYEENYLGCAGIRIALDKYKKLKLNNGKTEKRF